MIALRVRTNDWSVQSMSVEEKRAARRANPTNITVDNGREEAWRKTKTTNCAQLLQQSWHLSRSFRAWSKTLFFSLIHVCDSLSSRKIMLWLQQKTFQCDLAHHTCSLLKTMAASARRSLVSVPGSLWSGEGEGDPGTGTQAWLNIRFVHLHTKHSLASFSGSGVGRYGRAVAKNQITVLAAIPLCGGKTLINKTYNTPRVIWEWDSDTTSYILLTWLQVIAIKWEEL